MGTVDDGLTEEDTRIGLKPGDEFSDLIRYASLPKPSLPLLLALSLSLSLIFIHTPYGYFLKFHVTHFSDLLTFYQHPQPHSHTHP